MNTVMNKNIFKYLALAIAAVALVFQLFTPSVNAADIPIALRTVPLNDTTNIVLTQKDISKGKKLFTNACATCHLGGATFTNPNVNLSPESLAGAYPTRNNILGLVDYMKNPTTYDGVTEINDVHPSLKSTDIFPIMRGLTDNDLKLIAGYILYEPKVKGIGWGGGKVYY
ncbi:cytochrome c-550 [Pseudanabaena sp. FACHB-1277]|jgi:photosystem II cytochrome c550|uniref:Photosystem II extrinsic protein V n=1 Tax=Pseudanabaena cinerea FACHB-1277 TaxID=2949581 RepID=A0A926UTK2_9CYAN|nr:photosystem II cytochrome c-550 [Pseudanabaena cinerea]MBD2151046.1 cytochrome c-550 [Pseudanabaena cinerea FACHB-1277]